MNNIPLPIHRWSDFTYFNYCGSDAWGRVSAQKCVELNDEFEQIVFFRFPGIHIQRTIDTAEGNLVRNQFGIEDLDTRELEVAIAEIADDVFNRK